MSDMNVQNLTQINAPKLRPSKKAEKTKLPEQAPDSFKKADFSVDNAMETLKSTKIQKGKASVPKFGPKELNNLKIILTESPDKWNAVQTLAATPHVKGKTVSQLATKKTDVLNAMVPYAKEPGARVDRGKYTHKDLMLMADNCNAEQLKAAKPLIKTQLSGENVAVMALTPSLEGKLDKAASKVMDMEKAMGKNLHEVVFDGNVYDTNSFVIKASTKNNELNTEMLDKDLNRQAIENMSLYQSGSQVYQIKKVNDLRNNTTSKVRLEIDDQGYPTATHEVRVIKNKAGKVVRKEYTAPSDVKGVFDIVYEDAKGNKTQVSEGHYDKKTGITTVKKNMTSLNGTKTTYSYEDDPKGNRIVDYKITDKNGKVLLDKSSTFEVVDDNHFISTRNNEKYDIKVDKHDINVVDMNNPKRQARISIDNQIKGNKEKIMKSLKAMPGEELFKVAQTTKKLVGNKDVLDSYYDPTSKEIHSGENLFVILHELGHARDYRDVDGSSDEAYADTVDMAIQEDPEVQKVYDKERKAFNKAFPDTQRDHVDYFINKVTHYGGELGGLGETIAESNALLTTPKTHELLAIRSQYLQQYFPETIAKLSEKLSEEIA